MGRLDNERNTQSFTNYAPTSPRRRQYSQTGIYNSGLPKGIQEYSFDLEETQVNLNLSSLQPLDLLPDIIDIEHLFTELDHQNLPLEQVQDVNAFELPANVTEGYINLTLTPLGIHTDLNTTVFSDSYLANTTNYPGQEIELTAEGVALCFENGIAQETNNSFVQQDYTEMTYVNVPHEQILMEAVAHFPQKEITEQVPTDYYIPIKKNPKHRNIIVLPEYFEIRGVKISREVWAKAWLQGDKVKAAKLLLKQLFLPEEICTSTKSGRCNSKVLDPNRLKVIEIVVWWMQQNKGKNPYVFNSEKAIEPPDEEMEDLRTKAFVETRNERRIHFKAQPCIGKRKKATSTDTSDSDGEIKKVKRQRIRASTKKDKKSWKTK